MNQLSSPDYAWQNLAPILDECLAQLAEPERNAVLLRFFQDKALEEVGGQLGISQEAARKRVTRALEKLRSFFVRRGFSVTAAALSAMLIGHGAEAAPARLASTLSSTIV